MTLSKTANDHKHHEGFLFLKNALIEKAIVVLVPLC